MTASTRHDREPMPDTNPLMVARTGSPIIMLDGIGTGDFICGTIVWQSESSNDNLGRYSNKWVRDAFVPFHGRVVLET